MVSSAIAAAVLLLNIIVFFPANSQVDPAFWRCSGSTNYTSDGPFKSNLDLLLADLTVVSMASMNKTASIEGSSNSGADAVYGLSQCRPDVLAADCAACLNRSAAEASFRCPFRRSASILFEECFLRFSDRRFFGILDEEGVKTYFNVNTSSDPTSFDATLTELLKDIASRAPQDGYRVAAGRRSVSEFVTVYGIAQCTRDLSVIDCTDCMTYLLGRMMASNGSLSGAAYVTSCSVFYKIRRFFSVSLLPPESNRSSTVESVNRKLLIVVVALAAAVVLLIVFAVYLLRRNCRKPRPNDPRDIAAGCVRFSPATLKSATGNFCERNKLGQGGFGPVYLGLLPDGRQIAVKRLSRTSAQGDAEMKNEVSLLGKLYHKNLVPLLGFCLEEKEKIVVYEYLPNQSLDKFLFNPEKSIILTWEKRFKLIEGICRGLTYLHEYSVIPIIHRDLKASNILLDGDMNPKISDFGLAKLFPMDETHCSTSHVAGTLGYMAPEYIFQGRFSPKSDVFSFGVIILELVTGKRIGGCWKEDKSDDLLSFVWSHWIQGAEIQVIDPRVAADCQRNEAIRCIQIGLLCVQEKPSQRPSTEDVALMLYNSSLSLPAPSRPGFHATDSNSQLIPREDSSAVLENIDLENGRLLM